MAFSQSHASSQRAKFNEDKRMTLNQTLDVTLEEGNVILRNNTIDEEDS